MKIILLFKFNALIPKYR